MDWFLYQWTGFYVITAAVMKELKVSSRAILMRTLDLI